jgi:hypothetical protein
MPKEIPQSLFLGGYRVIDSVFFYYPMLKDNTRRSKNYVKIKIKKIIPSRLDFKHSDYGFIN